MKMRFLIVPLLLFSGFFTINAQDIPLQISKLYPEIKISTPERNDIVDRDSPEAYFITSELRERRDNDLEELIAQDSFIYDRLDNGNIIEFLGLGLENGEWVNGSLTTNTYDSDNQLTQSLGQSWSGTEWVNSDQDLFYYENNNEVFFQFQTWDQEQWRDYYAQSTSYFTGTNLVDTILVQNDFFTPGMLGNDYFIDYEDYNENGDPLVWYRWTWEPYDMVWQNPRRYEYTYNAEGRPVLYQTFNWEIDTWIPSIQTIYTYNAEDYIISTLTQSWDVEEQDWVNIRMTEREYNEDGNITFYQASNYEETGSFIPNFRAFLTYDEEGRRISILEQSTLGTDELMDYFLTEYTYYEDIGERRTVLFQEKDIEQDVWIETARNTYYYDLFVDTEEVPAPTYNVSITPNPSTDVVQINFEKEGAASQEINAELINSLGSIEKQFIIRAANHQLDVSNLTAGVYWIRLNLGQQFYTKPIVIH